METIETVPSLKKYGELFWEGEGAYGTAYASEDNETIIKITTDEAEFKIAEKLLNEPKDSLVKIYQVFKHKDLMVIVQEKLNTDFDLSIFHEIERRMNDQGLNWMCFVDYFEEGELTKEEAEMVDKISAIIWDCRSLGMDWIDLHSENIGIDKNGKMKHFDVSDCAKGA